jgi:amino acid adenylation domain-containing protein
MDMERPHPPFTALVQVIFQRLHARPEDCALRFRGTGITNGALLHAALILAEHLREAGIGHGTRTGVCLERGPEVLALLLALWWRGAVYVPLDPALPRERLFAMCETADLELMVTGPALRKVTASLPCSLLVLEEITFDTAAELAPLPGPAPATEAGDLAYILFTSGSSGTPKGVKISQGNLAALFAAVLPLLRLPAGCRILGCANFSFDIAFFELLAPLLCGGSLVLADQATCNAPLQLLDLLERERVSVVQATPSHWQLLTALSWKHSVTLAIATGEALLRDTAAAILQRTGTLWNLYGPTECTLWSSAHRVSADDLVATAPPVVSIGTPLPGYTLQLEHHPEADAGGCDSGELVIGGAGVSPGYCALPESGSVFRSAPSAERRYYSGDLCRHDAQGLFHYLGRRDNQVKHNGFRIELDEIALLLQQHMSIGQAVCLVRPARTEAPSLLFACVTLRPGMPNRNKTALNDYLAASLPAWMLPQRYFFLDRLPLNGNGKLDRAALLALATAAPQQTGALEAKVAAVFCEVLDIDTIGPCDSFLDAGGSSMLAATLVLTLNERLGSTLTLRQALATPPTVSSILQLLRATAAASSAT